MTIGIDMGHNMGAGASRILNETTENRKIGKELIRMLKEKGHTVIDCTCENAVKQLSGIVSKANAQALDVFCSIHLNAGGGHGTETYIWNGSWSAKESNRAIAKRVNDLVVASCGFKNRGVKEANFYVLKETVAPAILVEVCFVDSQEDANKLNCTEVAKAIFKGLTGSEYTSTTTNTPTNSGCDKVIKAPYVEIGGRGKFTVTTPSGIKFRDKYCTHCGTVQGVYNHKESVYYDQVCITEKYVWISWMGGSGARRWMPIEDRKTNESWGTCV